MVVLAVLAIGVKAVTLSVLLLMGSRVVDCRIGVVIILVVVSGSPQVVSVVPSVVTAMVVIIIVVGSAMHEKCETVLKIDRCITLDIQIIIILNQYYV